MFFTRLSAIHDIFSFDCGNEDLNIFLKEHAISFMKRKLCLVHVLKAKDFYTKYGFIRKVWFNTPELCSGCNK